MLSRSFSILLLIILIPPIFLTSGGCTNEGIGVSPGQDPNPPNTRITKSPAPVINVHDVTFAWIGSDDQTSTDKIMYSYSLDGKQKWTFSTQKVFTNLTEGKHTFTVAARDRAGNIDPSPPKIDFEVDTTPPQVILSSPVEEETGVSGGKAIEITFSEPMNQDSVEANLLASPAFSLQLDWEGNKLIVRPNEWLRTNTYYTLSIRPGAQDLAGNGLERTWNLHWTTSSNLPPKTTIIKGGPDDPDVSPYDSVAYFEWTGTDDTTPTPQLRYSYKLNDENWSYFSYDTSVSYKGLSEGSYTFYVKAKDMDSAEDYPSPAMVNFEVIVPPYLRRVRDRLYAGQSVTIVCMGDSVTYGMEASDPSKCYVSLFGQVLRERYPQAQIKTLNVALSIGVINNGIPAETSVDALNRVRRDVVPFDPDLVTICYGINDSHPQTSISTSEFRGAMSSIIEILQQDTDADILLITPNVIKDRVWLGVTDARLETYNNEARSLANGISVGLVDVHAAFRSIIDSGTPLSELLNDYDSGGHHPNDEGHEIYQDELMKYF